MRYIVLGLILLLSSIQYALADGRFSGTELAKDCSKAAQVVYGKQFTDTTDMFEVVTCMAYVRGASGQVVVLEAEGYPTMYCIPENSTFQQEAVVLSKYLNAHPAEWDEPPSVLVAKAFIDAFPCNSKKH